MALAPPSMLPKFKVALVISIFDLNLSEKA
jgi:hypothetical protein